MQAPAHFPPNLRRCDRTDQRRQHIEEISRPLVEIGIVEPPLTHQDPVQMIFTQFFHRPRYRLVRSRQPLVEVDAVLLFQVPADHRRIRDDHSVVLHERQLSPRSFGKAAPVGAIRQSRHFQQHDRLAYKRTGIGQPEIRAEGVKRDHRASLQTGSGHRRMAARFGNRIQHDTSRISTLPTTALTRTHQPRHVAGNTYGQHPAL